MEAGTKPEQVTDKQVRQFGVVMLVGLGLIGLILYHKASKAGEAAGALPVVLPCIGAALCVAALSAPRAMVPVYKAWMLLGHAMGAVVSRVILGVVFYVAMAPMGLAMRMLGRDPLERKHDPAAESYWIERPPAPPNARYWRQF